MSIRAIVYILHYISDAVAGTGRELEPYITYKRVRIAPTHNEIVEEAMVVSSQNTRDTSPKVPSRCVS